MKYEQERGPQAYNHLLPGSVSSQLDNYTSQITAIVSVMLTAADIQGADLSEPLVLLWHRHWEGAWNKLTTATLSWLSFIPNTPCHLALLSQSLGIGGRKRPDSGLGCCHNSLCMFRHTALFSIVPQPILTLHIPSLTSRSPAYHCGYLIWVIGIVVATRAFQSAHLPILPFTAILYILQKSNQM